LTNNEANAKNISMQELLTTKELADLLRLNEKKIYHLVREGAVPHVRIAGKWLFPKEHILRWIDESVERERDLLIVGSDDMLLTRLLISYSRQKFPDLTFYSPVGSLRGIQALSQRKGQACCVHLLDLETGEYNLPFLKRQLSPQQYVVVNLWYRRQGLIVKKGNPLGIKGIEDIGRTGARFINRNEGSGTRILADHLIQEKGLNLKEIVGFGEEADSHLEVALKVFFGEADAGMGIEYVTHLLPLDFTPLQEERFDLVVPRELWPTKLIRRFIAYIDPVEICRLFRALPGYDLRDTGKIIFES
jgi:putative molybdopterin biosynthesis protein